MALFEPDAQSDQAQEIAPEEIEREKLVEEVRLDNLLRDLAQGSPPEQPPQPCPFIPIKHCSSVTIVDRTEIASVGPDESLPNHTVLVLRGGAKLRLASPMAKVVVALGEPWVTLGGG